MNTAEPSALVTEGVVGTPLERADQLQPGVIISGQAARHAWQVLDATQQQLETEAGWIRIRQLMRGVRSHSHQWATPYEGAADCSACGLRRQRVADLLPVTSPRVQVIVPPVDVVNGITQYTLYATTSGRLVVASGTGQQRAWNVALPIIPLLRPIWSLPEALRALLNEGAQVIPGPVDHASPYVPIA